MQRNPHSREAASEHCEVQIITRDSNIGKMGGWAGGLASVYVCVWGGGGGVRGCAYACAQAYVCVRACAYVYSS